MPSISRQVAQRFYLQAMIVGAPIFGFPAFTGLAQKNDKPKPPAVRPTPKPPDSVGATSSKPSDIKVNFKTTLLVLTYPGPDVKQLTETTTIEGPQAISLYWRNGLPSVPVTRWQLSSKPMPENNPSPGFPGYIATGLFKSPAPGQSQFFDIDLKKHISPSSPNPAKYYVRVVAEQGAKSPPLIASTTVVITIHKSNQPMTKFTFDEGFPQGRWVSGGDLEVVGIHSAMMPNGKVLSFGYKDGHHFVDTEGRYQLWDPQTRKPFAPSTIIPDWNPFCSGHCFLSDARLFVAGGFKFGDPFRASSADKVSTARANADGTVTWRRDYGKMEDLRWYPTVVTLANGDCLIIGGSAPFAADNWKDTNADYEYFNVDSNYLVRHNESQREFPEDGSFPYSASDHRQKVADGKRLVGLYPLVHLLPNGPGDDAPNGLLFVLNESFVRLYNPATNRILNKKIDAGGFRTWWTQGSSVLLPIDIDVEGHGPNAVRIMVIGGGTLGKQDSNQAALATADIYRFDVQTRALRLESSIRLNRGRILSDSHLLPDGNVVLVGGAEIGYANTNRNRIRKAEMIHFPRGSFLGRVGDLAESKQPRGYHASSVLLPDGSIFVTGGNGNWDNRPVNEFKSVEIFEPPYLFLADRPIITSAPTELRPGASFSVATSNEDVDPVIVLIRNSSRTHSLDTDQRMLRLQAQRSTHNGSTILTAKLPRNSSLVPPGPYMLFLLRTASVTSSPQAPIPSHAQMVQVLKGQEQPPVFVNRIRLTIRTGGDDLRGGDDNAFASIRNSNGSLIDNEFPLNGKSNWANYTVHYVTHELSTPVKLSDLRRLRIRTTFGGGLSGDNWNIDRISLDYQVGQGTWQSLYDRSGKPLIRLTGERNTWETSF